MLIMAGGGNGTPLDYEELDRWTRVGYDWVMRWRETLNSHYALKVSESLAKGP
jgi:hypothetical protein